MQWRQGCFNLRERRLKNHIDRGYSVLITTENVRAAGSAIRRAIAETEGPLPPAFLMEFLLSDWRRYLVRVHQEFGADSEEWKNAIDVTNRLILSVLPVEDGAARAVLVKGLLRLVADVRLGIAVSGMAVDAREDFLRELQAVHLLLINTPKASIVGDVDLSQTFALNTRDPRYRALLDKLDGLDSVEHINL